MASLVLAAVKLRPPKHPMLIKLFQSPLLVDVTFFYLPQYFYFSFRKLRRSFYGLVRLALNPCGLSGIGWV
jgi:hypothetical protein